MRLALSAFGMGGAGADVARGVSAVLGVSVALGV